MNIKKLLPLVGLPVFVVAIVFVMQMKELRHDADTVADALEKELDAELAAEG